MIKINFNKWIIFLIISSPIIDLINGAIIFLTKYQGISIGQAIRILFLFVNIFVIYKLSKKQFCVIMILSLFLGVQTVFDILLKDLNNITSLFSEIVFNIKFLYNISLIVLVSNALKKDIINRSELIKYTIKSVIFICLALIITTMLNLNIGSYGEGVGSRGLFTEINALTNAIIVGLCFQLNIYFKQIANVKELIKSAIILIGAFMLGTKASILFSLILLIYFLIRELFSRRVFNSASSIGISVLVVSSIGYYFTHGNGTLILSRLGYFYENLDLLSFLLSARNQTLVNIFPYWISNIKNIFIGTGYINGSNSMKYLINGRGSIEMDFFDIYYFWGIIIGSIVFISVIVVLFKALRSFIITRNYNTRVENIIYIIIVISTFLGGHVLFSPLAAIYFAVVYSLNKYTEKGVVNG